MKTGKTIGILVFFLFVFRTVSAQHTKPDYHPCVLKDSVDLHLRFIELNASRIFIDSFDCKQMLFDSIAEQYINTKDKKYIDALNYIHNSSAIHKVENLYTEVMMRLISTDLSDFLNLLYLGRGKYFALEKEFIVTMNMIVGDRPYKMKYMGLINVEISKAEDNKDTGKAAYLKKLKQKIDEDKF